MLAYKYFKVWLKVYDDRSITAHGQQALEHIAESLLYIDNKPLQSGPSAAEGAALFVLCFVVFLWPLPFKAELQGVQETLREDLYGPLSPCIATSSTSWKPGSWLQNHSAEWPVCNRRATQQGTLTQGQERLKQGTLMQRQDKLQHTKWFCVGILRVFGSIGMFILDYIL